MMELWLTKLKKLMIPALNKMDSILQFRRRTKGILWIVQDIALRIMDIESKAFKQSTKMENQEMHPALMVVATNTKESTE